MVRLREYLEFKGLGLAGRGRGGKAIPFWGGGSRFRVQGIPVKAL